jgi:cation diffusion facilitator CzcD-associated flavoprotein CzcO
MREYHEVLIIGAGFSGICQGIFLNKENIDFIILE